MMSINAVKGVEIGAGFAAAAFTGEQNADEIRMRHGKPEFLFKSRRRVFWAEFQAGKTLWCGWR